MIQDVGEEEKIIKKKINIIKGICSFFMFLLIISEAWLGILSANNYESEHHKSSEDDDSIDDTKLIKFLIVIVLIFFQFYYHLD